MLETKAYLLQAHKSPCRSGGADAVICGKDHFQCWSLDAELLLVLQTQSSISSTTSSLWGVYPHCLHLEMSQSVDGGVRLIPNCCSALGTRLQKALSAKAELGLTGGPVWQRQLFSAAFCTLHVLSWLFPHLWPDPHVPAVLSQDEQYSRLCSLCGQECYLNLCPSTDCR